jgi:small conductance mechanosensitive channel
MQGVVTLFAVTTAEKDACSDSASAACLFVYRRTHNDVVARTADWLIARPFKILLILVLAAIASRVLGTAIRRFVSGLEKASVKRGLGEPGDTASLLSTGALGERAHQRAETLAAVLKSLGRVVIWTVAGLTVLGEFDINLGPLLAGAGIVGVAVGFGAQTLVRDFLSGVFMLIEDQFGVGDAIDAGEATGVVEGISLRTTRLRDVHGTVWHIPNGEIKRVGNQSQEWSRALLDIAVAHGTDVARAQQVIKERADDVWRDERWAASILEEPEVWGVQGMGATGITIRLVVKTRPGTQDKVMRALRREITSGFQAAGIQVPVVPIASPLEGG